MPKEMDFFIFLLENYAAYKGTSADQVLSEILTHLFLKDSNDVYSCFQKFNRYI